MLFQDLWGAGPLCKGTLQRPCWLVTKPFHETFVWDFKLCQNFIVLKKEEIYPTN